MAALTDDKQVPEKEGKIVDMPMAVDIMYRGALMKINAAGFTAPCAAEAGAVFAGVAYEKVDNSAGSAGDESGRVQTTGVYLLEGAGFAQSDVGSEVYASDDQTISTVQGANEQAVGDIEKYVSATQVWVRIRVMND